MMIVLRKSTLRPEPSVRCPSSKDLQHGVEDLGMGLFDLVEEHHGVGLTTHGLR